MKILPTFAAATAERIPFRWYRGYDCVGPEGGKAHAPTPSSISLTSEPNHPDGALDRDKRAGVPSGSDSLNLNEILQERPFAGAQAVA